MQSFKHGSYLGFVCLLWIAQLSIGDVLEAQFFIISVVILENCCQGHTWEGIWDGGGGGSVSSVFHWAIFHYGQGLPLWEVSCPTT